jgi:Uncharacterized protein conserved in bacteria (DUF2188)
MPVKGKHVVPRGENWGVMTSGAAKAGRIFDTQSEAIKNARDAARRDGAELYIHGRDGKIRERNSYGRDPAPPKS